MLNVVISIRIQAIEHKWSFLFCVAGRLKKQKTHSQ